MFYIIGADKDLVETIKGLVRQQLITHGIKKPRFEVSRIVTLTLVSDDDLYENALIIKATETVKRQALIDIKRALLAHKDVKQEFGKILIMVQTNQS